MISISGVRGVYGETLDEALAERFAFAFGTLYNGVVVVGRDSRKSGKALAGAVISGLGKAGCDVIDLGLASTPTTETAVPAKGAAGGVIVTASHNPGEWNGLKFLGPDGVFLDPDQGKELLGKYESVGDIGNLPLSGSVSRWEGANEHHVRSILDLDIIDGELVASSAFTVCLDTVNGAGGIICPDLLERLGCTVHGVNLEPTGDFAHDPEPVPAHLRELCALVKEKRADVGFAVDPDVDRLSIVDEHGTAIGEEYSLAFAVDYVLGRKDTPVACNLSTSRMVDDAAARHGRSVERSLVGEINVVGLMRGIGAGIGGEGNGGIIYPPLHHGRDAVLGMALILQLMAERRKRISELAALFPRYHMIKEKVGLARGGSWIDSVKERFGDGEIDERDGIKVVFPDSWVHVRESNTEPIVRVVAEARSEEAARNLVEEVRRLVRG